MKKLLIFLLILSVFLCGCAPSPPVSDSTDSSSEDTGNAEDTQDHEQTWEPETYPVDTHAPAGPYEGLLKLRLSFGERTGTFSGVLDDNGLPTGQGTFTARDPNKPKWTYDGEWVSGHWEGTGSITWEDGKSYIGEFSDDSETGNGILTMPTGEVYEGHFLRGELSGDGKLTMTDGAIFEGTFANNLNASGRYTDAGGYVYEDAKLEDGELSFAPLVDFFGDTERQNEYKRLYESYRYSDLIEYINDYITANNASPIDSAYTILALLTPAVQYEGSWNIKFDEYDGKYSLTFDGADRISSSNSVEVSVEGTGLSIKIGFRKKGWLFFDYIGLSVDGEEIYGAAVRSSKVTRNVISGGTIEEYCFCSFYDDVLASLKDAGKVILRFENRDSGEVYDHTLSQAEIDALYCGLLLRINNRDLSDLLYRYNRSHQ